MPVIKIIAELEKVNEKEKRKSKNSKLKSKK